ncbi:MAG TPA: hypothetical protein VEY11_20540 [Pyrinomonadaceae bacterium]|nr:hypothetical protein [Pyrinomonadaceae bacterium]
MCRDEPTLASIYAARVAIADVSASAGDYVEAGRPVPALNFGTGVNGLIYNAVGQSDDKVIVAGSFSNAGGIKREVHLTLTGQHLIDGLAYATLSRAQAHRAVVQSNEVQGVVYQEAFVAMQYYGHLRRTPAQTGYESWLRVTRRDSKNIRIMIDGLMNSIEYRLRSGQP